MPDSPTDDLQKWVRAFAQALRYQRTWLPLYVSIGLEVVAGRLPERYELARTWTRAFAFISFLLYLLLSTRRAIRRPQPEEPSLPSVVKGGEPFTEADAILFR